MAPQIKPKQICIQMGKKNATCLGGGGGDCMKILVACSMELKVNGNEPLRKIRRSQLFTRGNLTVEESVKASPI